MARITSKHPGTRRLKGDGLSSGRGAGVVHLSAWRDRGKAGYQRVGGILYDERAFGEAWKILGYWVSAIGYWVKANSGAKRCFGGFNAGFAKSLQQRGLTPTGGL